MLHVDAGCGGGCGGRSSGRSRGGGGGCGEESDTKASEEEHPVQLHSAQHVQRVASVKFVLSSLSDVSSIKAASVDRVLHDRKSEGGVIKKVKN